MQEFLSTHWLTVLLALGALVVWTLGNYLKRRLLVWIGIALCVLALLSYTSLFDFVYDI